MCLIILTFAACGFVTPSAERVAPPAAAPNPEIEWRQSRAVGAPSAGRLVRGVQLPSAGARYFTWDPLLHRRPDRPGRRWGTDLLVRKVLRVVSGYAAAHPSAPRLGIGDLSRPRGGPFGPRHASHQNGLDADVYYPRRDHRLLAAYKPALIDHALAQRILNRFVDAGAQFVFVGTRTGLRGPRKEVEVIAHHNDHMHVRIFPPRG